MLTGNVAPAGVADTVWNQVANGDIAAGGLLFGDGSAASSISVDIGASPENNNGEVIDFLGANARGTGGSGNDGDAAGGVYDTALVEDWLFTRRNG